MPDIAVQHSGMLPKNINRVCSFSVEDVRRIATIYPETLADAAEYARRFFPKAGTLARAA